MNKITMHFYKICNIFPIGEIDVINSEGFGNSCTILTRHYRLYGRMVLFTITELSVFDFVGQIVDCQEKTVLYACKFCCDGTEEKQDMFDLLLTNYTEWRFSDD